MPDERSQAINELVGEWLRRARNDLALAQLIDDERIAPDILVFHAQQAAEKAIKALLVQHQIEPATRDDAYQAAQQAASVLAWVESLL